MGRIILNPNKRYYRLKQILYDEDGNQILKFKDTMPDGSGFTGDLVINMNKYILRYLERIEVLKKENVKLNLF